MYDDKWSIMKIVIKIINMIAETFWYSNILKEDCNSYPIPPAPTMPSIVAILILRSRIYKLFATKDGIVEFGRKGRERKIVNVV